MRVLVLFNSYTIPRTAGAVFWFECRCGYCRKLWVRGAGVILMVRVRSMILGARAVFACAGSGTVAKNSCLGAEQF